MSKNNDINPWDTTPDLSGFKGAHPKQYKAKKKPKGLNKVGKRTGAWLDALPVLTETFKEHGIVSCEIMLPGCDGAYHWGFAHVIQRGNFDLKGLVDPHHVVLACNKCHRIIDDASKTPKPKAQKILEAIVKARGW